MAHRKHDTSTPQVKGRLGFIIGLTRNGLGLVQLEQSKHVYIFTFDAIPGYRGESVRELDTAFGIRPGTPVIFSATSDKINELRLAGAEAQQEEFHAASCLT